MICSKCNFDNPQGASFCAQCGTALRTVCSKCGSDWDPGFRFCAKCGNPLGDDELESATRVAGLPVKVEPAGPQFEGEKLASSIPAAAEPPIPKGERRNVTVLFADFSCFTPLSEQLDPEELTQIMQFNFTELREEITSREGWLAKYIGDAVLAVFGAPVAHEDDPLRAVRAALAMITRTERINERLKDRIAHPLQLHIGINSGLVFAGPTTETGGEFTVLGDTVNTGARLQRVAGPGKILVGEATYLATYWAFDYAKLPPLEVKGKRKKVTAYECLRPRAHPLAARGIEGIRVPMLGRMSELARLKELFTAAALGRPQVVSILGDAGIGKSRLAHELIEELESTKAIRPWQIWSAFATSDPPEPFGVARQLFTERIEGSPEGGPEHQLASTLAGGAETQEGIRHLDPEHRRQRLYLLAAEVVSAHAKDSPLLLMIEDLQWADEASIELLHFLVARPQKERLLVLFTHRPEWDGPNVWSTRADLHSIHLGPLPEEVIRQLLMAYFGKSLDQFPSELVQKLVQGAGGNPFYLEEMIRSLVQQGVITREERWRVSEGAEKIAVPDSLQGLLLARMDRLEPAVRLLLQEAAVLGQTFDARLLESFTSVGEPLPAINELIEGSWLEVEDDRGRTIYRFHHNLVREVAYESLLIRARSTLHERAGELIEKQYPDALQDHVAPLAEHYYRARNVKKALVYLEDAGDRARAMYANSQAIESYRRALELLADSPIADRGGILVSLGDALRAEGKFDEAIAPWNEAVAGVATMDPNTGAAINRRIADAQWHQGRVQEAHASLEKALGGLGDNPVDSSEVAHVYHELADQSIHRGNIEEAIQWAEKALEVSQRIGAHEEASLAATTLGVALARAGDIEKGQEYIERALVIASEHDFPIAAGRAALNLAVLYANTDPLRAAEICEKGLAEARRVGDVSIQPWFYATLAGSLHACASDYETAIASAEMAIEIDKQLGLKSHLPVPLIVLGQIHQCHNRWDEAETHYREALALAEEIGDPQLLYPALEGMGTLFIEKGDTVTGEACMEQARLVLGESGTTAEGMMLLPFFL